MHPDCGGRGVGHALLGAVEHRAREFGLSQLLVESALNATSYYRSCGYEPNTETDAICSQRTGMAVDALKKPLTDGFSDFQKRILDLLNTLNIPADYGVVHSLAMQR